MIEERYLSQLQALAKSDEAVKQVPDRVKQYTHDIHGRKLPCEFVQLNEQLVFHLNKIPAQIAAKNDYFAMVFGYPGSGKSHLLQRIGLYLNSEFSLNDIVFTPRQLDEWIEKAKPGSVGVFDEADIISDHHANAILQAYIRNLKRIRTKRLIIFSATPTMKDMKSFFAYRAKLVLYSFIPKNTAPDNRGWIHAWHDQDLIADLFARMKKAYSENSQVYNQSFSTLKNKYNGRSIPPDWPIDEKAYEDKKEAARKEMEAKDGLTPDAAVRAYRERVIKNLELLRSELERKGCSLTTARAGELIGVSRSHYSRLASGEGDV